MRKCAQKSTPALIQHLLMAGALFVLSCGCLLGQTVALPSGEALGMQIITPIGGVDFSSFAKHLLAAVKDKWLPRIPESGRMGKGKVVVRLRVQQDGSLSGAPTVDISSATKSMNDAAVSAVRAAAPFDRLPESFKGPSIELRLGFFYNLPPSSQDP